MKSVIVASLQLVLAVTAGSAFAEDAPPAAAPLPWKFAVESDPSTFALSGFSVWAMTKPADTQHLRVGVGAMSLDFPSFVVPHLNRTGETGWGLDVTAAMGFAAYQFGDRKGLYIGAYSGYLESSHTRTDTMGTANRDNLTILPTIGYQWFPFASGRLHDLYIEPWLGASVWFPVGGTTALGSHTFKDPFAIPLAAVHLGFEI